MNALLPDYESEINRLTSNQLIFFETVPDMLLIINENYIVEKMNPQSIKVFGDNRGQKCHKVIFGFQDPCANVDCPIRQGDAFNKHGKLIERMPKDNFYIEINCSVFKGYKNDQLFLLSMRDITQRKLKEIKLIEYQDNLKTVLENKIQDLNHSEQIRKQLLNEVNYLKKDIDRLTHQDQMVGESKPIRMLRDMIYKVAPTNATVLITGESGTGKELVADQLYNHSNRVGRPYLKFNCAAIPDSLMESDLFGYEKGAFTGATARQKGKFEVADGGTIFLDEIGDISPRMQAALLRVLQNGEILRVGGTQPITVDVRVIAATNTSLVEAVKQNRFREDLYYRLNVFNLEIPPLRERKEDIVALAIHMLKKFRKAFRKNVDFLPDNVVQALLLYDWPGNIRELENIIQRAVLLSQDNVISLENIDLPDITTTVSDQENAEAISFDDKSLREVLAEQEKKCIKASLCKWKGDTKKVAENLVIGKTALYEKMKRYNFNPKQFKDG